MRPDLVAARPGNAQRLASTVVTTSTGCSYLFTVVLLSIFDGSA
jgi:hypothetical protein